MARKTISLDEKIDKAEAAVLVAKARYDKALDELEKLVTKKKQLEDKRILEAINQQMRSLLFYCRKMGRIHRQL